MPLDEAAAAEAARALREKAREHKRASATHRRSAKRCMRDLAELKEQCQRLGIKLVVDE